MPSTEQAYTGALPGAFGFDELPSASSLLSSRWSRDNLVTSHPGRLYDGEVLEVIDADSLEHLLETLRETRGPLELGAGHMGVHTWDITCFDDRGAFVLQVPRALDEAGRRGRRKCGVPRQNFENARRVIEKGLTRFALEPRELLTLGGNVPAATFAALLDHHVLTFGRGSAEVELIEGERSWMVSLGPARTADLLAEMIAALVYHYEPDVDGGTAIVDVCINDGDFVVTRGADGTFALRLTALRHRETGIGPSLLMLYLVQMMAYEDWSVGSNLSGLPVLISNPSLAFEGVVRGLRYRHLDLGLPEEKAVERARAWVEDFGRSPESISPHGVWSRPSWLDPSTTCTPRWNLLRRPPSTASSSTVRAGFGRACTTGPVGTHQPRE
jgi:hypothetical protein